MYSTTLGHHAASVALAGRVHVEVEVVRDTASGSTNRAALAIIAALSVQSSRGGTSSSTPSDAQPLAERAVGRDAAADGQPLEPGLRAAPRSTRIASDSTIARW